MNKWYFSRKGSITEAMDLEAAKEFVVANPDAYGWQKSYTQWLPIHCISDFADITPPYKPLAEVPQVVVDEFNHKAQKLVSKLDEVNTDISSNEMFAQELAQEINAYKQITQQLSPEVQANINSIEQQYNLLQQRLNDIKQSTSQAANEISNVVANFDLKIANKSVAPIPSESKKIEEKQINIPTKIAKPTVKVNIDKAVIKEKEENTSVSKLKTPEEKQPIPDAIISEPAVVAPTNVQTINTKPARPPGAKVISTRSKKPGSSKFISASNANSAQNENTASKSTVNNEKIANSSQAVTAQKLPEHVNDIKSPVIVETQPTKKESLNEHSATADTDKIKDKIGTGVKSIFTSMFGTESSSPSISGGIKDLVAKEEVAVEEVVNVAEGEIDEEPTKRKRRRRR